VIGRFRWSCIKDQRGHSGWTRCRNCHGRSGSYSCYARCFWVKKMDDQKTNLGPL